MRKEDAAYEELVRERGPVLMAIAMRHLGNAHDAEDVVQESFVNVFRSISRFKRESSLDTWLHRIVTNCALMRLRRRRRKPEVALDGVDVDGLGAGSASRQREATPFDLLAAAEANRTLIASISNLPAAQQSVLLLRGIAALDMREAACVLDITPAQAKTTLRRARRALRMEPNLQEALVGRRD